MRSKQSWPSRVTRVAIAAVLLGGGLCAIAVTRRARVQSEAVAVIRRDDGEVTYDWELGDWEYRLFPRAQSDLFLNPPQPPIPCWIESWLGTDLLYSVVEVRFPSGWKYVAERCNDETLKSLHSLPRLQHVKLGVTRVTESGVRDLQKALPSCVIDRSVDPVTLDGSVPLLHRTAEPSDGAESR